MHGFLKDNFKFSLKKIYRIRTLNRSGLLKSGDILIISMFLPLFRKFSKKTLKKYQLKWNLSGAGHAFRLKKNFSRQSFLRIFASAVLQKYWKFLKFICLVKFLYFTQNLRIVSGFFKIKKVIISLFCFLSARNVVSSFCLKKSGFKFRRKSLNYLLSNYNKKLHRLYPIRRMHKKKKKNR